MPVRRVHTYINTVQKGKEKSGTHSSIMHQEGEKKKKQKQKQSSNESRCLEGRNAALKITNIKHAKEKKTTLV